MGKRLRTTLRYRVMMALLVTFAVGLIWAPKSWAPTIGITVSKICVNASGPGMPIEFSGTVTNTGGVPLEVTIVDDHAGFVDAITLGPGDYYDYTGAYIPDASPSTNVVTATGVYESYTVSATADATCTIEGNGGNEGCTPGYWKNHLDQWAATGYSTGDDFDTAFGTEFFDPDITLGEAIRLGGGGVRKLARHGTAALLSASHPDVEYPLSEFEVIQAVQASDSDTLAEYNELGCPMD